jgi:high-affinity K+ transport system ATPase subunit B
VRPRQLIGRALHDRAPSSRAGAANLAKSDAIPSGIVEVIEIAKRKAYVRNLMTFTGVERAAYYFPGIVPTKVASPVQL